MRESSRRLIYRSLGLGVAAVVAWLLWRDLHQGFRSLNGLRIELSPVPIAASVALMVLAFLCEGLAWRLALNAHLGRSGLGFGESIAVYNVSALMRYVPGRVWVPGAQMVWLSRRGISEPVVLYANALLLWANMLASIAMAAAAWLWHGPEAVSGPAPYAALGLVFVLALTAGPRVIALGVRVARRITRRDMAIGATGPLLMLGVGALSVASWVITGISTYYAALGVGIPVTASDVVALAGATALGWVIGHVSMITPGGLGVREGTMFLVLDRLMSRPAALVIPIVSRLLFSAAEILLAALGLALGVKLGLLRRERGVPRQGTVR